MTKTTYILAPHNDVSGGVESLYQLAHLLNLIGKRAFLFFKNPDNNPIPDKFVHYNNPWVNEIEDNKDNLLVVPEIWTEKLSDYKNIQKSVWWLSVHHNWGKFQDFQNTEINHFCQSYFSQHYLHSHSCYRTTMLNDYIELGYATHNASKEDIICYSPAKGIHETTQIIEKNPDLKFVPVTNMTRSEIINLLSRSKVYIDFGYHPGRDRIPREAALLNNCIVTNLSGSAGYFGDIPIPISYKITDLNHVGTVLKECLINYDKRIDDFSAYRRFIDSQKMEMQMILERFF